jgi:hypothetical protein
VRSWASRAVQGPLGNDERIRSKKSGPSAGGEAPRPSKFELPRAGGGPTRLTKPPKLHSFRLRGSQIREVPHFREGKSGPARCIRRAPRPAHANPLDAPHRAGFRFRLTTVEHRRASELFDQTACRDVARFGARQCRRESFSRTAQHRYAACFGAGHFEIGA